MVGCHCKRYAGTLTPSTGISMTVLTVARVVLASSETLGYGNPELQHTRQGWGRLCFLHPFCVKGFWNITVSLYCLASQPYAGRIGLEWALHDSVGIEHGGSLAMAASFAWSGSIVLSMLGCTSLKALPVGLSGCMHQKSLMALTRVSQF